MSVLPSLAVALPFLAAAAALLAVRRRRLQRAMTLTTLLAMLVVTAALGVEVASGGPVAEQVGGWPAGYAIPLVADGLAVALLAAMGVLSLASVSFAALTDEDRDGRYLPLVLVVIGGVTGALLTGDLFNLFVFFEVMLAGSYVLLGIHRGSLRASAVYIVTSLLASALLLVGIALLYGSAGTLHLGRLHGAAGEDAAAQLAGVVVLAALTVKSAAVPVHGWLPHAYPAAPAAIAALFSGLLTKVGVYALLRVSSLLFDGAVVLAPLWALVAVTSMVVGVAGALGRSDIPGILSFHMVSQIGYLLVVLALIASPAAVRAGIFFLLQYIFVKGGLFLVSGAVAHIEGSTRLRDLGGLARGNPLAAAVFLTLALSLAGLPPLSGFVAKYLLAVAAFEAGALVVGGAVVGVSLCTLLSMLKIWNGAFWAAPPDHPRVRGHDRRVLAVPAGGSGDDGRAGWQGAGGADGADGVRPDPAARPDPVTRRGRVALLAPAAALAVVTLVAGIAAAPLLEVAQVAAAHLLDAAAYAELTS